MSALRLAAVAASCTASRVVSTIRTWRSAPCATSLTAEAISPTARPASSEVDAISCDADDTVPALAETSPISVPSCERISLYADTERCVLPSMPLNVSESWPSSSRDVTSTGSVTGCTSCVRSPSRTASSAAVSAARSWSSSERRRLPSAPTGLVTLRVTTNASDSGEQQRHGEHDQQQALGRRRRGGGLLGLPAAPARR